ncbi:hypothetical protein V7102_14990 [Bacillus velezensis]|uniref:hypothetical protein n=1 Tax=Bacillus velezensis TaxID=492670 RepID=UPI002FFE9FB1
MNAHTMAVAYHTQKQEWKTLEEALLIVDDPDTKQGISKEIYKRRKNIMKIREELEQLEKKSAE